MLGTGYQQEVGPRAALHGRGRVQPDDPRAGPGARRWSTWPSATPWPGAPSSHLTMPTDVQMADADAQPYGAPAPAVIKPTAPIFRPAPGVPETSDLARRPEVLNGGTKVAMLVGAGARGARAEVLAVAELLASPIIKTLPGKAVVPDDHPLTLGGHRPAGDGPLRGGHGGVRHPAHGGHELSLHQVPARGRPVPRWSRSKPTRSGPGTDWPPRCP